MKKEEKVIKETAKPKKILKESIWHDVMQQWNDWVVPNSGDGGINMSPAATLRTIAATLGGITLTSAAYFGWDKFVNFIKGKTDVAKKIVQAAKQLKSGQSPDEVASSAGVSLKEGKKVAQIGEIKSLVEQVEKTTGKKVVFYEAETPNKQTFDSVKKDTPQKALENWASGKKFPKGGEPHKATATEIISSLKDSGFEIVPASKVEKVEKKPTTVNEAKKPEVKKTVPQETSKKEVVKEAGWDYGPLETAPHEKKQKLQDVYQDISSFLSADVFDKLNSKRVYTSAKEMWVANPTVKVPARFAGAERMTTESKEVKKEIKKKD